MINLTKVNNIMKPLELNFYSILGSEEFDKDKFNIISKQFNGNVNFRNPFLILWCMFLTMYPLKNTLKKVFNDQETDAGKLGVASRHLIKQAKKVSINQYLIDEYVTSKHKYKEYKDRNKRLLEYDKERLEERMDNLEFDDKIDGVTQLSFTEGRLKENTWMRKERLHRNTLTLLKKIVTLKHST